MEFEYHDILKNPPTGEDLNRLASLGGTDVSGLLNAGSKAFKEKKLELAKISNQEAARLIQENPRIMRRPLLTDGEKLVMGFKPEDYASLAKR